MRLALELTVPDAPADARAAAIRGRDLWLASARSLGVEVVGPNDASELRLRVAEPEAVFSPAALAQGLETLREADIALPVRLEEPYAAVWELERLGESLRPRAQGWEPAPATLSRTGTRAAAAALPSFVAHSFAGRKSHPRPEVEALVPANAKSVLELGCGEGVFAAALEERGMRATGIERDRDAAAIARSRLSRILPLGIDEGLEALRQERFDVIVAADVLEHLDDPGRVLDALRPLAPRLVVSLPNATHAAVLGGALQGRWDRALEGIVADDHRTYAGRAGFGELLASAGWDVTAWQPVPLPTRPAEAWLPAFDLPLGDLRSLQWLAIAERSEREAHRLPFEMLTATDGDVVSETLAGLASRDRVTRRFLNPLSAIARLASGGLVTGRARAALFSGITRHELVRRFGSTSLSLEFRPVGEGAVPKVALRAAELGLPVMPEDLRAEAWDVTFS